MSIFRRIRKARRRRDESLFLDLARKALTRGARALVVVSVDGFEKLRALSPARCDGAVKCLQLYLESSITEGECLGRLDGDFGLIVRAPSEAYLSRRLSLLSQDISFLYQASYPALKLRPRIGAYHMGERHDLASALQYAKAAQEAVTSDLPFVVFKAG